MVLVVGLTAALVVVFARPIRYLLDVARAVEDSYGLTLVPALIILTVVFLVHQYTKRQEAARAAATAVAEAGRARARAAELEGLVVFGQALARALDLDAVAEVVRQHLARVAGGQPCWVIWKTGGAWSLLARTEPVDLDWPALAEEIARRMKGAHPRDGPFEADGQWCFPLVVGEALAGVLGVCGDALSEERLPLLSAAATLVAIAIQNAQLFCETRDLSARDRLTGCVTRAYGIDALETELGRARRAGTPVAVLMLDLDHFKAVNDRYGHLGGDAVLATVGRRLRELLRRSDVKCRYGGEEFLVILPETSLAGAVHVAEWLRGQLASAAVAWGETSIPVTASLGVTVADPDEQQAEAIIARADAALYEAKRAGRNCVRVHAGGRVMAAEEAARRG